MTERLEAEWLALGEKRFTWKKPMWWAIYRAFRSAVLVSAVLTVAESATMIAQPILIGYFIGWMLGDEKNSAVRDLTSRHTTLLLFFLLHVPLPCLFFVILTSLHLTASTHPTTCTHPTACTR